MGRNATGTQSRPEFCFQKSRRHALSLLLANLYPVRLTPFLRHEFYRLSRGMRDLTFGALKANGSAIGRLR